MKNAILLLTILVGAPTALADDFAYLTFLTTEGAKASVAVGNLTLTISGTTLSVGSQSFPLSNQSKMYFSTSDETTSAVSAPTNATLDEATDIYDLQGHKVDSAQMQRGVYIVKTKNRTYKIVVK